MKKSLLALLLIVGFSASVFAGEWKPIRSDQPVAASVVLISSNVSTSVIQFKLDGFFLNKVNTPHGAAYTVSLGETTPIMDKNAPDLPKMTASVIIPDFAMMDIEEMGSSYVEYSDIEIAPSKGNLSRDIDPSSVQFEYGRVYNENTFYPGSHSGLRDPFILRDYRGQTVIAYPFQYNPVTKVLRVYTDITVKLKPVSNNGFNVLNQSRSAKGMDQDFSQVYPSVFLNTTQSDYAPLDDYGRMLVICYTDFMQAMQPFVDWKNSMGIKTEMVDVATIGSTPAAIKAFVENYYNTNGLTFLLLVGDAPQIPTNTGSGLGGPSDNAYGYLVGNDHYPDIFVGRFSAENADQVTTMVQRTIEYEKSPLTTFNWFDKGFGIGSDQGPGDDNEYDYQHMRNIRADLITYTYASVGELYDGSQGGEDLPGNPSQASVSAEVNDGRSIINYVGHGSDNSWGTTGFSGSNVDALSNNHMWPFILSVACVNGNFAGGTCFAEHWLRAKNAEGPTGAVATLMSTINQSWNPPMEGQDEMDDILVESYPTNIKRTFGGLSMNGCYKMNESYGADGNDMTDTWTIFGDPSVMVRTDMPKEIIATHDSQVFIGATSFTISSSVEGALVALSVDNQFVASGFIANGTVSLDFPAFQAPDTLKMVITAYNYMPNIADIPVIPNDGPYLVYNQSSINDASSDNDGLADFGETVLLGLALTNVGSVGVNDVHVTLTSTDSFIDLIDSVDVYPLIPKQDTVLNMSGFSFSIHANVPDAHIIPFHFTAVAGNKIWTGNFTVMAHSGVLNMLSVVIDDTEFGNSNQRVDPGEKFSLVIDVKNTGTANIANVNGQVSFNNSYLHLQSAAIQNYGNLAGGESETRVYKFEADAGISSNIIIPFAFMMTANQGLLASDIFNIAVGQNPVAVVDLDGNQNSGPAILSALEGNNVLANYTTLLPADLGGYTTLFICLGVGSQKHVLTTVEGERLANFLDLGGKLYMEGGDTWYFDAKTAVHPKFKANGTSDGGNDLNSQTGVSGQFTENLSFSYTGDNYHIDQLAAVSPAFELFKNSTPSYVSTVACDAGSYRTIASSFEFGGLANGYTPSTRSEYMKRIIEFFTIPVAPYSANFMGFPPTICSGGTVSFTDFSTPGTTSWSWTFPGGTPTTSTLPDPVVAYAIPGLYSVYLLASNGTNSDMVSKDNYIAVSPCTGVQPGESPEIAVYPNPASAFATVSFGNMPGKVYLKITDAVGKIILASEAIDASQDYTLDLTKLNKGVYFVTVSDKSMQVVKKLIIR